MPRSSSPWPSKGGSDGDEEGPQGGGQAGRRGFDGAAHGHHVLDPAQELLRWRRRVREFNFGRFYWEVGEGERESIAPRIDKKKHPVRSDSGAILASAAKVELVLPHDAPQEYMSLDHLVRRYEETLPAHEVNAYAQVTIRFPDAANLHQPYEMVRAWVRTQYPHLPVILVLHAPHEWGSSNFEHVHCIVFPRRLGSLGWAAVERAIASDIGQREAYESWTTFRNEWAEHQAAAA